jgi:hypothetical protein
MCLVRQLLLRNLIDTVAYKHLFIEVNAVCLGVTNNVYLKLYPVVE